MSANNIVVFEEQANGTFKAFHRDMDCYCEGQLNDRNVPIFFAKTMRECVEKYEKWEREANEQLMLIEYGYVFELRADNRADPS